MAMALPVGMPRGAPEPKPIQSLREDLRRSFTSPGSRSSNPPRISNAASTRPLLDSPRDSHRCNYRNPGTAIHKVKVDYDTLCHLLRCEMEDWFADRGYEGYDDLEKKRGRLSVEASADAPLPLAPIDDSACNTEQRALAKLRGKWSARATKWRRWYHGEYDGVSILRILNHARKHWWESWRTNPYNLNPWVYLILLGSLMAWSLGSIVCGYYEARRDFFCATPRDSCMMDHAAFWRGVLGSIPGAVQSAVFLFPPLYVPS